ncbi:MAG: hypothetical protein BWY82_02463 [Verrucomicrobia bacterium ADurb.Bin474]|nr:MAG: hypothetical protein BWY82_02463 [Verrucomicrobia bacterium ADurb.Bin474]
MASFVKADNASGLRAFRGFVDGRGKHKADELRKNLIVVVIWNIADEIFPVDSGHDDAGFGDAGLWFATGVLDDVFDRVLVEAGPDFVEGVVDCIVGGGEHQYGFAILHKGSGDFGQQIGLSGAGRSFDEEKGNIGVEAGGQCPIPCGSFLWRAALPHGIAHLRSGPIAEVVGLFEQTLCELIEVVGQFLDKVEHLANLWGIFVVILPIRFAGAVLPDGPDAFPEEIWHGDLGLEDQRELIFGCEFSDAEGVAGMGLTGDGVPVDAVDDHGADDGAQTKLVLKGAARLFFVVFIGCLLFDPDGSGEGFAGNGLGVDHDWVLEGFTGKRVRRLDREGSSKRCEDPEGVHAIPHRFCSRSIRSSVRAWWCCVPCSGYRRGRTIPRAA